MQIEPYLFFEGRCEEAIEFYRTALGAEVETMMRFSEAPEPHLSTSPEKIMHARLKIGSTFVPMSDGMCSGQPTFKGMSLALTVPEAAEAERLFGILAESGTVSQPMTKTFFAPAFGVVTDKFGVGWLVLAAA